MNFPTITALLALALPPAFTQGFRVGRSAIDITPPVGAPIGSSYGITPAASIHDPLFAKAIVMETGGAKAAMVACDLISLRKEIVAEARRRIAASTGLRGDQVILSATHCHAGPQMHPLFLALTPEPARRLGEAYVAALPEKIAEAVRTAERDLQPARVWTASVEEREVSFNRRFLMKDGTVRMNPGRGGNAVRAMGPIDPEVAVVYFDSPDGRPLATHVNFALHVAIAGGSAVSADYPGVMAKALAQVKGPEMVTVFTNGMSGNVNHLDIANPMPLRGQAEVARVGTILAGDVLRAYRRLRLVAADRLTVRTVPAELPTPAFNAEEVARARQTIAAYGKPNAPAFDDVVHAWKVIDIGELRGKPLDTEVQAIALGGELAWVGMPGDAFVELGLAIKQNSPFVRTIVSEQSGSGAISYVPNRKAFPEGAYEVISARFSPGGGERLVDAAIGLLMDQFASAKR